MKRNTLSDKELTCISMQIWVRSAVLDTCSRASLCTGAQGTLLVLCFANVLLCVAACGMLLAERCPCPRGAGGSRSLQESGSVGAGQPLACCYAHRGYHLSLLASASHACRCFHPWWCCQSDSLLFALAISCTCSQCLTCKVVLSKAALGVFGLRDCNMSVESSGDTTSIMLL